MEAQTKRTLLTTLVCLVILFGWIKLQGILYPPPPPTTAPAEGAATTQPAIAEAPTAAATEPATTQPAMISALPAEEKAETAARQEAAGLTVVNAESITPVMLGDDRQNNPYTGFSNPYEFSVTVTPRGAGVESVKLSRYRNKVAKSRRNPDHDPYDLLQVVKNPQNEKEYASLVTDWVRVVREDKARKKQSLEIHLDDKVWSLEKTADDHGETATLRTTIKEAGADLLAIEKTYRVEKGSHDLQIGLSFRNLSDQPFDLIVGERGPTGIKKEDPRSEYRRTVTAVIDDKGVISVAESPTRDKVFAAEDKTFSVKPGERHLLWSDVGNKYFACIVAPLPQPTAQDKTIYPKYLSSVAGRILIDDRGPHDDLTFEEQFTTQKPIPPRESWAIRVQAFCGAKSKKLFDESPEATARNYIASTYPDHAGCTFEGLSRIMLWLLTTAYRLVHNYGIAIIILVIIVRVILHPISRYGQINMMKMQKGMAKLKPKMEALQQQYKNDKQKLNEEMMKLYSEEGISPAGQFLGCLPMMLQMPVWVALWTTLNTNVDMRHMPFFWWIKDLSSPDALIPLPPDWYFNIPLIGGMVGSIEAFNLLPVIMGVSMYLQQKLTQKLTKPLTPPTPQKDKDGKPVPDQMAQQQKMMNFMMIFFGLMFYNFPSGLNLYIFSSNLLGMGEQWLIRKHIREKEERGDFAIKKKEAPAGPSLFQRLQKLVEQAQSGRPAKGEGKPKKKRKQPRF
ncbi:MAG TPA: YidC/Oxa1 family insertase periplasmic-domain containing protein [Phycisphaerae bacterium]|nr:YidC/Oxa1 family insertase periplasmic-domain containing protein [Phycisphaerae bacterium]